MGFVSCLEDQQKRFESDCHILHHDIRSGKADGESAKKTLGACLVTLRCVGLRY